MPSIYIYGASGHGQVVADIARECGYEDIYFIDDGDNEYPSIETVNIDNKAHIALGIGNNNIRANIFNKLKQSRYKIVTLVHPSAVLSPSAVIGVGTVVMPNVVINAQANVGHGTIINSSAVVEHECHIGDFAHISPNVALAGNVKVGTLSHIGIGSNIIQGIMIGEKTIVGAGSVVVNDIGSFTMAYGNPCRVIKEIF